MPNEGDETSLLQSILDGLTVGLCASDPSGRLVLVNRTLCEMLGATREEMLAERPPYKHWPAGTEDEMFELFFAIRDGRAPPTRVTLQRRDGTRFPARLSPSQDRVGDAQLRLIVFSDLSEEERRDEELDNLRGSIRAMSDQGVIGAFDFDVPTATYRMSPSYWRLLGYDEAPEASSRVDMQELVHPDDLPATAGRMTALLDDRATAYQDQVRLKASDGTWHWVLARGYVESRGEDGRPLRVRGTTVSIHQLKLRELQLRALQNLELLGQLSAGIAHDFNNLLAVIHGNLVLLEATASGEQRPYIDNMMRTLKATSDMVKGLLARGRNEPAAIQTLSVEELMEALPSLLRAVSNGVEVSVRNDAGNVHVRADRTSLENCIINLVLNARDAVGDSGHIEVSARVEAISTGDNAPVPHVLLMVQDDGPGMAPEVAARAVLPLFTTKPVGEGTGLGLSMVSKTVHELGGQFEIHGDPGNGTRATMALPLHVPSGTMTEQDLTAGLPRGTERVVVVDDQEGVLEVIVSQLGRLGYEVYAFDRPRAALAWIHKHPVDVLLTDIYMPYTLDGVTLARRAAALQRGLRVLFMTGFAGDKQAEASTLGTVLHKPFEPGELARELRAALDAQPTGTE